MVYYIILNLSLAIDSSSRLLNIYLSLLVNPFYIKNMYCTSILVVLILFSYILVKQGSNHSNALLDKNNSIQATCFITISSPSPLLVILILICIRNPFNLQVLLFTHPLITTCTPPNYYIYTPYFIWFRRSLIKLNIASLSQNITWV